MHFNEQFVRVVEANRVLSARVMTERAEVKTPHRGEVAPVVYGAQKLKPTSVQGHYCDGEAVGVARINFEAIVSLFLKKELHTPADIGILSELSPSLHLV